MGAGACRGRPGDSVLLEEILDFWPKPAPGGGRLSLASVIFKPGLAHPKSGCARDGAISTGVPLLNSKTVPKPHFPRASSDEYQSKVTADTGLAPGRVPAPLLKDMGAHAPATSSSFARTIPART